MITGDLICRISLLISRVALGNTLEYAYLGIVGYFHTVWLRHVRSDYFQGCFMLNYLKKGFSFKF